MDVQGDYDPVDASGFIKINAVRYGRQQIFLDESVFAKMSLSIIVCLIFVRFHVTREKNCFIMNATVCKQTLNIVFQTQLICFILFLHTLYFFMLLHVKKFVEENVNQIHIIFTFIYAYAEYMKKNL